MVKSAPAIVTSLSNLAADAGPAGIGHYGFGSKDERREVTWLRGAEPDLATEWAVLGSNQ